MKSLTFLAVGSGIALAALVPQAEPITAPDLKKLVEGLGLQTKMLNEQVGREKFEFIIPKDGYDIPIAAELSSDRSTIWFVALLGPTPDDVNRGYTILKENNRIRPNMFFISEKGDLMIGVGLDNRGVNAAVVRKATDSLALAVTTSAKVWQ
jgi:hypothetical protein